MTIDHILDRLLINIQTILITDNRITTTAATGEEIKEHTSKYIGHILASFLIETAPQTILLLLIDRTATLPYINRTISPTTALIMATSLTEDEDAATTILTTEDFLVLRHQHSLATIEAEVITTTIYNGAQVNEADLKVRTIKAIRIQYSHHRHPPSTTNHLQEKKKICSDRQKICKWRTKQIPGHQWRQTTKVILQLRTPNSALPSNPKLLLRLQLKLLQI
jgi:hypothetical protein